MLHETTWNWFSSLPGPVQRLVLAALVLVIGWSLMGLIRRGTSRALTRARGVDPTLRTFFATLVAGVGWILLVVVVLAVAGVDIIALMGGLAVGGFIVGFALKDTLGNLAAGILLLFHRPYHVGEVVEIAGHTGKVLELGMALTRLRDLTGRIITVPNGAILGSAIVNHTREPTRQAVVKARVGYHDDLDAATRSVLAALAAEPRVLSDPAPNVQVALLGADAVELNVTAWLATPDLGPTTPALHRLVKEAIQDAGCTIPVPQRDVRMKRPASA